MADAAVIEWLGALWSVDRPDHDGFRCVCVDAPPASGWHLGDTCWLTAKEVHPSNQAKETS